MTVQEAIDKMTKETYSNEKAYQLMVKDAEGNEYKVVYYDWCNATLVVEKI